MRQKIKNRDVAVAQYCCADWYRSWAMTGTGLRTAPRT